MQKIFKIVKIIDEFRVVVNAGADDLKEGTVLEVFEAGNEITDPDTGENLGTLDFIKAKLYVEDVLPKMCICRNYYTCSISTGLAAISKSLSEYASRETIKELNVNSEDISGGYDNVNKKISVGDKVRESL